MWVRLVWVRLVWVRLVWVRLPVRARSRAPAPKCTCAKTVARQKAHIYAPKRSPAESVRTRPASIRARQAIR